MTPDAIRLKDNKNKLWRRYKKTRHEYDHIRFKNAKNRLRALTRNLRVNFENNIARDAKLAPKKFWGYVKSKTKTRSKIPLLTRKDGTEATSAAEKAEALNEFFCTTFTEEDLTNVPSSSDQSYEGETLGSFNIEPEAVQKKLHDLNPGKTPGEDGWHPIFLKNITDLIIEPLTILFQKSLNEGVVPPQWLNGCITAIHKKEERNLCENYRPVSITSIICKLMESIIRDKLVAHMEKNKLFSRYQHGFVPRRNCISNLLICMEMWTEMIERGLPIDVIYTDFAKAFDRVPHQRLLRKMKDIGITGDILAWVESFLSGRKQCVQVDGERSSWKNVKSGIPQGSVLGPILFVIFINDMPEVVDSMCQLFADDAKVFRSVDTKEEIRRLQVDIDKLHAWSEKWQLLFNVKKCKCLHIGHNNTCHKYKMNGAKLDHVDEEKDLGVLIDDQLKFHRQTASAVKKANRVLGLVKKTFAVLDMQTLPLLYTSLVRGHLEYGNIIWGPFFRGDILAVERVQRRATKLVSELKHLPYEERLRALGLPSLSHRRRRGDMIQMFKIMSGEDGLMKDVFSMQEAATRGHACKVKKGKATKAARINCFSNRVVDDWNDLPAEIVTAKTVESFKSKLDEFWEEKMYDTPF